MKNLSNLCIIHSIQSRQMFDHFLVDSIRRGNSNPTWRNVIGSEAPVHAYWTDMARWKSQWFLTAPAVICCRGTHVGGCEGPIHSYSRVLRSISMTLESLGCKTMQVKLLIGSFNEFGLRVRPEPTLPIDLE